MHRVVIAFALALTLWTPSPATATSADIVVNVEPSGHFVIHSFAPDLTFAGDVGHPLDATRETDGQDGVGAFHQVESDYGARTSTIRSYPTIGAVLFTTTYSSPGANSEPFPVLTEMPRLPYTLSYRDVPFSPYQLNSLRDASDSPWLFFDSNGGGFLISPASNFAVARMTLGDDGTLTSGIDTGVGALPAGFTHQTLLVIGTGINRLFSTWGNTLTALHGKSRPSNDADVTLEKLGYWTDNGAAYYYHFEPQLGYAATLLSVVHELEQRGITPGYLQLDSWWYPKGAGARWDDRNGGIFRYRAASDLFPNGLAAFQAQVGLPLVTHARWIDPVSPYRNEFAFSGNVMTDPRYWADLMSYLRSGGVVTYEQDWLGAQAQPVYDLSAPAGFMDNMVGAAAADDLTLQYCMPLPRHVLQTVDYSNVTSARVSDDRFGRDRWDTFLYTSQFAGAIGVWPWADVFMSSELDNLLLADLSAGVVGIGDALGAENVNNLHRVMRADAVLVKPDAPLVPTDASILAEATGGPASPMVAWTYSDHGPLRGLYVFAYARSAAPATISISPAALGVDGPTYVYDYFRDTGRVIGAGEPFNATAETGSYYVVAPVGPSGIALLGDRNQFATLGAKRISDLRDDGRNVEVTIEFAAADGPVTLFGYAPSAPSTNGVEVSYDPATGLFSMQVPPPATQSSATVVLTLA